MQARILGIVVLLLSAAGAGAQSLSERAARDETIRMSDDDLAMRQAFDRASATLADFLRRAAKPEAGTSSYALKVAISEGKRTEYFWVTDFVRAKMGFRGTLANEPRVVKTYRSGQRVTFSRTQIVDWTYYDDLTQRTFGNFTACALLSREPPDQAVAVMQEQGLTCED